MSLLAGLEPTSQLSQNCVLANWTTEEKKSGWRDLNPQSSVPKTDAITYYATPSHREGIEPSSVRLTVLYSTFKLTMRGINGHRGIRTPAGRPNGLANHRINHSAICQMRVAGLEPTLMILETIVLPIKLYPKKLLFLIKVYI